MSYACSAVEITVHSCGVWEVEVAVSGTMGVACDRLSEATDTEVLSDGILSSSSGCFLGSEDFSDFFFFCHHI